VAQSHEGERHGDTMACGDRRCLGVAACSKAEEGDNWSWAEWATWPGGPKRC
jgi:hypothetical protein